MKARVIGAGLAGSEAAYQLANRNIQVELYEQKPVKRHDAFKTDDYAELICSNSLRSDDTENAVGLLKEEMRILDSLIMKMADRNRVPAGKSLAVDRVNFSRDITDVINSHPNITVIHEEIQTIDTEIPTIICAGPLCEGKLAESLCRLCGNDFLHFYDAIAPIVEKDSIDFRYAYYKSRYGEDDDGDYINCPLTKEEYEVFWEALVNAEKAPTHDFEKEVFFEGCMPAEVMAARGKDTLLFGPMKPVGLEHPETGERPYAVVQLRQDDAAGTLYNIVGFQTHLTWPEQRRVFSMIPALAHAEFTRYGVMHRNTFINSPLVLRPTMQLAEDPRIFFAGQMTGVEGYVESAAAGLMAGVNAARILAGEAPAAFPPETAHGALAHYITTADPAHFQPMNVNFGLMPPLSERVRDKKLKKQKIAERALLALEQFKEKFIPNF